MSHHQGAASAVMVSNHSSKPSTLNAVSVIPSTHHEGLCICHDRSKVSTAAIGGLALTACSDNPSNVPAFEDIEETMWESMAASDAVAMTAVVPESLGEDVAMLEELYGGNLNDLEIYGSLTEPATAIRMGEDQDPLLYVFEDEMFVSLEMTLEAMAASYKGLAKLSALSLTSCRPKPKASILI